MLWGWALFGLFCLLFGGTVVVALRLPLAFVSTARRGDRRLASSAGLDHRAATPGTGRGSRSRTSSTRPGSGRPTGRPCSATTSRRESARGRAAPRARRLDERREGEPARVRLRRDVAEPPLRRRAEPGVPGPDAGRLVGRVGGSARARPRRRRARDGHGRLDSHPGRLLRHHRAQADLRARADRRGLPARAVVRPCRADGSRRRGLHRVDARPRPGLLGRRGRPSTISRSPSPGETCRSQGTPVEFPTAEAVVAGVHARGRGRPPRALCRAGGALRREHPRQGRTLPRRER